MQYFEETSNNDDNCWLTVVVVVCVQAVCVGDGGCQCGVDPHDPEHAGGAALHLHPEHGSRPLPTHRRRLPRGRVLETRQRKGTT